MKLCRNLLYGFAFLLGWLCFLHFALALLAAWVDSGTTTILLLSPLLIGLLLALVTARSLVARQWQKGPAFLLAAATFARLSLARGMQIDQLQHRADSWFDVALGLAIDLGWIGLIWLLSAVVYRSADRIFAALGRALARHPRFKAPGKAQRS
jgi:hypothetical protein